MIRYIWVWLADGVFLCLLSLLFPHSEISTTLSIRPSLSISFGLPLSHPSLTPFVPPFHPPFLVHTAALDSGSGITLRYRDPCFTIGHHRVFSPLPPPVIPRSRSSLSTGSSPSTLLPSGDPPCFLSGKVRAGLPCTWWWGSNDGVHPWTS